MEKLEIQLEIEEQRNNNRVLPTLYKFFKEDSTIKEFLKEHPEIPSRIFIRTLINLVIHKRIPLETFVGLLYRACDKDLQGIIDYLTYLEELQIIEKDEQDRYWSPALLQSFPKELEDQLIKWQYPLPLIIKPNKITSNKTSGYYTLTSDGVVLNRKVLDDDIYLEHINRVNSVEYQLDTEVLANVENKWSSVNKNKITKENFNRYMKFACEHIEYLYSVSKTFYFSWRYDKRGRIYPEGYYLNPQGTDWNKYVVQLAKEEVVKGE